MSIFYQNRESEYQGFLSVNNTYPPHFHRQAELIYVCSGEIRITIDGDSCILKSGDISLTFPSVIHSSETKEGSRIFLQFFDVSFVSEFMGEFNRSRLKNPFFRAEGIRAEIMDAFSALKSANEQEVVPLRLVKGYLLVILSYLLEEGEGECSPGEYSSGKNVVLEKKESSEDIDLARKVLLYLDGHYMEGVSLETLAKELGVSRFHLSRLFSRKLCTSFPDYLNSRRIGLAKKLLGTTELSVTEIAYECGFASLRTFYRAFSQNCGCTPKEYREGKKR